MLGARRTLGSRAAATETDIVINPTLYMDVSSGRALGLESNITISERGKLEYRLMPQFSVNVGFFTAQFGVGVRFDDGRPTGESAFRLITEL